MFSAAALFVATLVLGTAPRGLWVFTRIVRLARRYL